MWGGSKSCKIATIMSNLQRSLRLEYGRLAFNSGYAQHPVTNNNPTHEDRVLYKSILVSACLLLSNLSIAEISVGQPLPSVTIPTKGELILKDNQIHYQQWNSENLVQTESPKVHVVQYLAARMSASKINEPFTDKLSEVKFPIEKHLVTTIINVSDAMWGTGGFVAGELASNKKKHPHASMVADQNGIGAKTWELAPQSSAVMILSPQGEVLFFKDGALSATELSEAIKLIEQEIKALDTAIAAKSA